jgi:Ca2+-binding EF-hand superfamily protein
MNKGNGYISTTTLKELLREIAPDLSDKELDDAVDEIDEDGSGKIEFQGEKSMHLSFRHWNFFQS